jgi:glycosyltransferase involved in cell wall biosynthesis
MTSDRLNILIVSPALPLPLWGFGTRVYQLARHLSAHHDVTILSYARPIDDGVLPLVREVCSDLRIVTREPVDRAARRRSQLRSIVSMLPHGGWELKSRAMKAALDELLSTERFDLVQFESSQMRAALEVPAGTRVVLDEHNLESELLERMRQGERSRARRLYNRMECLKFGRLERRLWARVGAVAVPSEREASTVRQRTSTPVSTVPNGVDLDFFTPGREDPEPARLVFTGLLSYRPNFDAVMYLVDEILPRIRRLHPDVVLSVVGHGQESHLQQLRRPHVDVTGWVEDVRPYVARAAVVVVPLRIGGGTRLKVIEAMAMGKPIVSTSVGCEGLDVSHGEHLLVADGPERFASEVGRLLDDRQLALALGAAGRERAVEAYSWERVAGRLEELYESVLRPPGMPLDHPTARA